MVTRAASDKAMGGDIAQQIFASPRPLFIAAGLVCLFVPFRISLAADDGRGRAILGGIGILS